MRTVATAALILLCVIHAESQDKPAYKLPEGARFTAVEVRIAVPAVEAEKAESADEAADAKAEKIPAWEIAGTLNLPTGDKPEGGWAAVFFISGSGSQNRHGTSSGTDLGTWEVLDAVANAGFVVLRVDDRGAGDTPIGPEGTKPGTLGYHHLVSDARHCVHWLRAHEAVNADRVFVIGHSEGGLTAPILAGEGLCAGIVCMAAMGRNMYDIIFEQVSDANQRLPKATREANLKVQKEFQDAAKEGREPDCTIIGKALEPRIRQLWDQQMKPALPWFHDHFNLDVPAVHARVKCPVFVAQGASDFQVKVEADARQLARNLLDGQCTDLTLKVYDDLDHLFKPCGNRPSNAAMYKEDRRVSKVFLNDLVAWLKRQAQE